MEDKNKLNDTQSLVDKRELSLRFRVNQKEKDLINDRVEGDFSSWIRNLALGSKKKKGRNINLADPDLLFELNKIGVNLNQIAKVCNQVSMFDRSERLDLLLLLASIDEEIKEIRANHDC